MNPRICIDASYYVVLDKTDGRNIADADTVKIMWGCDEAITIEIQ